MRAAFETILSRYGQSAVLEKREGGEAMDLRAFLQPVLKEREHPPVAATPLGAVSRERWVYIGAASIDLSPGDRISSGQLALEVQETQILSLGDEEIYRWALLRRKKEATV